MRLYGVSISTTPGRVDRVGAERLMKLIRRDRLVLAGSDPAIDDVAVTALLKAAIGRSGHRVTRLAPDPVERAGLLQRQPHQ